MRVVITGHKGQLGRQLQAAFAGHEILGLDMPEDDITAPDDPRPHRRLPARPDRARRGVYRRGRLRDQPRPGVPGERGRHAERRAGRGAGERGAALHQHQRGFRRQPPRSLPGVGRGQPDQRLRAEQGRGRADRARPGRRPVLHLPGGVALRAGREQLRHQDPGRRGKIRRARRSPRTSSATRPTRRIWRRPSSGLPPPANSASTT